MAATQYQILCRYLNTSNNTFVTNETLEKYNPVFEFYNDKHVIVVGQTDEIIAAEAEKEQLIVKGNLSSNPNYNMLFKYNGVKRKNKKIWVAEKDGYVIRDWQAVANQISKAGDYSGDYVLVGGGTPASAKVVAKNNPLTSTVTVVTSSVTAANGEFFSESELSDVIAKSTIASLIEGDTSIFGLAPKSVKLQTGLDASDRPNYATYYIGPVIVGGPLEIHSSKYGTVSGNTAATNLYSAIVIKPDQVEKCKIPAHYEESIDQPYVICDTYERIETSPWLTFANCNSLEAAITKVKKLVEILGIDNVKLIKNVQIDQFVKVQ
jgi:hypothetical protein